MKALKKMWYSGFLIVGFIIGWQIGGCALDKMIDRPASTMTVVKHRPQLTANYHVARIEADNDHGETARLDHMLSHSARVAEYVKASASVPMMMFGSDGRTYWVGGEQTLGEAMAAGQEADGPGKCYRDDIDIPEEEREKNGWKTPCACTNITACDPKNGESPTCKRHCKKSECDCCAI